jgi:hypothetical protein
LWIWMKHLLKSTDRHLLNISVNMALRNFATKRNM